MEADRPNPGGWPGTPPLRAGLTAGSIGAVAGVLVNLPLESPSDTFFNSAPVMAGSLLAGLGSGLLWHVLRGSTRRPLLFAASLAAVLGLVSAAAVAGESQLARSVSYIVPFAAIVLGLTGVLTVLLPRAGWTASWRLVPPGGHRRGRPGDRAGRPGGPGERQAGAAAQGLAGVSLPSLYSFWTLM